MVKMYIYKFFTRIQPGARPKDVLIYLPDFFLFGAEDLVKIYRMISVSYSF